MARSVLLLIVGDGAVDRPLGTLKRNYRQSSKPDVVMKLSITNSGLKAFTKEHGLTEYWAHRITYCVAPPEDPKVFCWVYRHEGRKLKHELRCHAVLCNKDSVAKKIATELQMKIKQALFEYKRDKISRQNARLSLANAVYDNPSLPRRKILLSVGGNNYKPPLEKSKSAPKLMAIEELCSEEDEEEEPLKKPDISTNTWTKDMSSHKMCCKVEDFFPSYTLGRRKCDKRCLKKLSFKLKDDFEPATKDDTRDKVLGTDASRFAETVVNDNSENSVVNSEEAIVPSQACPEHAAFDLLSVGSEDSEETKIALQRNISNVSSDNDDVFYCESEDSNKNDDICENQNVDRGSQSNYMVLDSDEGSISSGCETASTVTSSDTEMHSLPYIPTQNEYIEKSQEVEEKISVLERVQSFEQLFNRERNHSVRNFRSCSRKSLTGDRKFSSFIRKMNSETVKHDTGQTVSDEDSLPYSASEESEPISFSDQVNLYPIGESGPRNYLRCLTYSSDDEANASSFDSRDFESSEGQDVCGNFEKEIFEIVDKMNANRAAGDSDSACSVESGYSEFSENTQSDCVIGQTVMV